MRPNQFTLKSLLLATMWFGLAAFDLAQLHNFSQAAAAARARGQFVCGNTAMEMGTCFVFALAAGVAAFTGHWKTMAIVGILAVALTSLSTIAN